MGMFDGLARFAAARRKARVEHNTQLLLDSLPLEIQKDIGWGSGRRSTVSGTVSLYGWGGPQG
ncbi:MAG: hypothetical protein KF723_07180 [Rhizobiaceae bacterium]|nr:hypothetical protein [Rhizobiaceae bacterium]